MRIYPFFKQHRWAARAWVLAGVLRAIVKPNVCCHEKCAAHLDERPTPGKINMEPPGPLEDYFPLQPSGC